MKNITIDGIEYELKPISQKVQRDYEILSYLYQTRIYKKNSIGDYICFDVPLQFMVLHPENMKSIHSVKRLSDNEIFTIGDTISSTWGTQVITGFLVVDSDNTITIEFESCRNPLSKIKRILFTTEDGKKIREGTEWWMVREEGAHTNEWEVVPIDGKKPIRCKAAFSTEEKAKEYVLANKPCLSFNDVLGISDATFEFLKINARKLREIIREKINV